ncbi:hypothetical protein GYMLUDRAFT_50559 [Collybiopsis luxurians FD-317 M1]|uniref:histidine kinase n=1 Tax=Collybiopsis luxurians FD-317 M1 TaxID=944289 RepID=A0A0D0AME4_9AGAR|nr:hypothetical protein GYMLUDRAFT_50559 [Collybiopsis luxurians FD-317 M1]
MDISSLPLPVTVPADTAPSSSLGKRPQFIQLVTRLFDTIRTNLTAGTPPSSSESFADDDDVSPPLHALDVPDPGTVITSEEEGGYVEKVVVEQSWGSGTRQPSSDSSDPDQHKDSKSGENIQPIQMMNPRGGGEAGTDIADGHSNASLVAMIRLWLKIRHFFYPRPFDVGSEKRYDEDDWYSKKTMAQTASIWLIINWALGCVSVPRPWTLIDYIFYAAIAPVFTIPIFVMVMYSWPRDRRVLFQFFVTFALWMWPFILIINIRICGFYATPQFSGALVSCHGKDFINVFFYATAMQAIGLFGLRLERLYAAVAAALWFVISCALIIPQHTVWWRSVTNFAVFHIFLIWVHERRESSERRLYAMKVQVKIQYKALQRAQANERRTTESKHRLTSYVFHEVRVPLNSALLAAQYMEASGTISRALEVEFDALMGSLTMMSQVLNDVLDFNRLDSGQFELVSKPYAIHQTIRSLFIPLQMATAQKGLTLHTELDPNIDKIARCAAYRAMGERQDVIERHLKEHPDVDGVVVGDEARFRQIITNFASNACKFTSEGGSVTVKTKLVVPSLDVIGSSVGEGAASTLVGSSNNGGAVWSEGGGGGGGGDYAPRGIVDGLSELRLAQHDYDHGPEKDESIVVRVEVTDTGCGIESSELSGPKLFSAFVQTERGKQQGGKGTGLGLALVRNIVKLSGGRLGVKSRYNKGSTFWVELPLGVGRKALIPSTGVNVNSVIRTDSQGSDGSMGSDIAKVRAAAAQQSDSFADGGDGTTRPNLRTRNSLTRVVDVAALKASEMSSPMRSSTLMHSTIMEQAGRVDIVVDSQTPSVPLASIRASPSIMTGGAPTPNTTDLSFSFHSLHSRGTPQSEKSQNLSIKSGLHSPGSDSGGERANDDSAVLLSHCSEATVLSPSPPRQDSIPSQPPPPVPDEGPPPPDSADHSTSSPANPILTKPATPSTMRRPTHIPIPSAPRFPIAEPEFPPSLPNTEGTSTPPTLPSSLSLFDNSFSRTGGITNPNFFGLPFNHHQYGHTKNGSLSDFSPGLSVLVVDDDGITRMMMERVLKRQGCNVMTAENGRVALEMILGDEWDPAVLEEVGGSEVKEQSREGLRTISGVDSPAAAATESAPKLSGELEKRLPDLPASSLHPDADPRPALDRSQSTRTLELSRFAVVFLDNSMPVLNGERTVEVLRRLKRKDFVVGLTGNALLSDQEEYTKAGVDIVLTKPVMQNKIVEVLKEADARRQHQLARIQKAQASS